MTRRRGLLFALALALVVFIVDQGIKSVVEGSMRVGESITLIPDFLSLTYIKNDGGAFGILGDRKSTRLNSSHSQISYAVFCLKKKKTSLQLLLCCCASHARSRRSTPWPPPTRASPSRPLSALLRTRVCLHARRSSPLRAP